MKQSDPQKGEINLKCETIAEALSNTPEGNFSLDDVAQQLATFYAANPQYRNAYAIAEKDVKIWDKSKRPKPKDVNDPQGSLFDPKFVVPTGRQNERVFMGKAKREHLIGWRKVETDSFESREKAYLDRIGYIDSRLAVYDVAKYSNLEEVENRLF